MRVIQFAVNYRPKGWKNPYSTLPEHMEADYPVPPEWSAFEAGADTILNSLSAVKYVKADETIAFSPGDTFESDTNGYLVFVPAQ